MLLRTLERLLGSICKFVFVVVFDFFWMLSKKKDYIFCILFGAYIAAVLWITLFSRIGDGYRGFLLPFHSYIRIAKGSSRAFVENVENVLLFIPLGVAVGAVKKWNWKKTAIAGFCVSLCIELLQAIFAFGIFECDDLINNTLGSVIGFLVAEKGFGKVGILKISRQAVSVAVVCAVIFASLPFGYQMVRRQHMTKLATLHDREDGNKNLLVLNGKSIHGKNNGIDVTYLIDGSMLIGGEIENDVWAIVSDIELGPGSYTASVLSADSDDLVKFKLAYFDSALNKYTWFLNEIDYDTDAKFCATNCIKLRVYLRVYQGFKGTMNVVPVVYQND